MSRLPGIVCLALACCALPAQAELSVVRDPTPDLAYRSGEGEQADGLRALLAESARLAGIDLSRPAGYARSDDTRLPPPPEMKAIATVMLMYGYNRYTASLQDDINRGLERTAARVVPAVEAAAAQLALRDVPALAAGSEPRATELLCGEGREVLTREYATALKFGLAEAGYYDNLKLLVETYNSIPTVADLPAAPELEPFAREYGVKGLCLRMADHERRLREDPSLRQGEAVRRLLGGPGVTAPVAAPEAGPAVRDRKRDKQEARAAEALQELLGLSIVAAQRAQSRPGGYLKTPAIRLTLPEPLQPAATALAAAGAPEYAEDLVIDMNVAAEISAGKALPLLQQAHEALVWRDALVTLQGDGSAAMRAYRRQSEAKLLAALQPIVQESLRRAGAIDSHRTLLDFYHRKTGAAKIAFDLELYVRERVLEGLYWRIGEEEARLRQAPPEEASKKLRRALAQPVEP